jgi:hypothetical protein
MVSEISNRNSQSKRDKRDRQDPRTGPAQRQPSPRTAPVHSCPKAQALQSVDGEELLREINNWLGRGWYARAALPKLWDPGSLVSYSYRITRLKIATIYYVLVRKAAQRAAEGNF